MRKRQAIILFGLFIFFPLLGFVTPGLAYQLQATFTPSATFIPPSVTPTVQGFACPVGTPAGWGTYTPSALWNLQCSNCEIITTPTITPTITVVPTSTHDGTGTPYPTSTLTITPTLLPTFTPTSNLLSFYSWGMAYTGGPYITMNTGASTASCSPAVGSTGNYFHCSGHLYGNDANGVIGGQIFVNHWFDPLITSGYQWVYWAFEIIPDQTNTYPWFRDSSSSWSGEGSVYVQYNANTNMRIGVGSSAARVGAFGAAYELDVAIYPISLVGPTATPTPTGTPYYDLGYCSTIAPPLSDFGFELFVPDGEINCNFGWDEFVVGDYTIPAVQICFLPVQFGVITLFGNAYEIGVYGLAAAAAFIWRFMRTV